MDMVLVGLFSHNVNPRPPTKLQSHKTTQKKQNTQLPKPLLCGTNHPNCSWAPTNIPLRPTCGAWVASLPNCYWGDHFYRANKPTFPNWIPSLLSLGRPMKPIGPTTRHCHFVHEVCSGTMCRPFPLTKSLQGLPEMPFLFWGPYWHWIPTCALPLPNQWVTLTFPMNHPLHPKKSSCWIRHHEKRIGFFLHTFIHAA